MPIQFYLYKAAAVAGTALLGLGGLTVIYGILAVKLYAVIVGTAVIAIDYTALRILNGGHKADTEENGGGQAPDN